MIISRILNNDITPGQLRSLQFTDTKKRVFFVYSVWMGQGVIKSIDLVEKQTNQGFKTTLDNLIQKVEEGKLIQL
jgi:hypothetical protein